VKKTFSHMHARALSHATERLDRVEQAMRTVVGDIDIQRTHTTGHHGNEIVVLEARSMDAAAIEDLFRRLPQDDLAELRRTSDARIDPSCVFHMRVDKQEAYAGDVRLAETDDAIALRLKVRSYPAKEEVAKRLVAEFLADAAGAASSS
jgi:RNA binding exosome subunit